VLRSFTTALRRRTELEAEAAAVFARTPAQSSASSAIERTITCAGWPATMSKTYFSSDRAQNRPNVRDIVRRLWYVPILSGS